MAEHRSLAWRLLTEAYGNRGRLQVVADRHDRPCPAGRERLRIATRLCAEGLMRCEHPAARSGAPGEWIYDFRLEPAGARQVEAAGGVRRAA